MRTPRPCADTHTHTHTLLCGYGLSTGPTDGLSSWWQRNRSPPDSQQQQQGQKRSIKLISKLGSGISKKFGPFLPSVMGQVTAHAQWPFYVMVSWSESSDWVTSNSRTDNRRLIKFGMCVVCVGCMKTNAWDTDKVIRSNENMCTKISNICHKHHPIRLWYRLNLCS